MEPVELYRASVGLVTTAFILALVLAVVRAALFGDLATVVGEVSNVAPWVVAALVVAYVVTFVGDHLLS